MMNLSHSTVLSAVCNEIISAQNVFRHSDLENNLNCSYIKTTQIVCGFIKKGTVFFFISPRLFQRYCKKQFVVIWFFLKLPTRCRLMLLQLNRVFICTCNKLSKRLRQQPAATMMKVTLKLVYPWWLSKEKADVSNRSQKGPRCW